MGLEVGRQRHLGIDGEVATAGEVHHQVGAADRPGPLQGGLLDEVAVGHHPGQLDHPAELHLPPTAAYLRRAEGAGQLGGLAAEPVVGLGQAADLR